MKKLITLSLIFFFVGLIGAQAQCCNKSLVITSQGQCCSDTAKVSEVKAYYFHATRRCATCQAVEEVTKQALKEFYGDKIELLSVNREEDSASSLVKKYKVGGQTLLFIKGDKVVNLTNDAFLNARTNPDKLKAKIKATIDSM